VNGTLLTAVGHDGGVDGVVSARVPVSHRLVEHQFNDPAIYLIFTWYLPGHLAHTWCRCTRHGSPLPLVPLSHRLVEYQFHEPAIYPLFTCYLPGIYLVTWPTWCGCTRHGNTSSTTLLRNIVGPYGLYLYRCSLPWLHSAADHGIGLYLGIRTFKRPVV